VTIQHIAASDSVFYTSAVMKHPKVIILRTAGTNCDEETVHAWEQAGADPKRVHVRELIHQPAMLREFAILTIPGGFSYGDDISAGKILANQIVHHLSEVIGEFVAAGKLVLGICNGFQVLVKSGLLPGDGESSVGRQTVTLAGNDSARFEDRWVHLKAGDRENAFLGPGAILALPIAHGEGKMVAADQAELERVTEGGHIALTYCDEQGNPGGYPINPNGSQADVAGLIDSTGRVLGLMPHPERHVHRTQSPVWTRQPDAQPSGRMIFENAVRTANQM
jgi:phosphoribosylformylglycinamidine synthase